MVNEYIKRTNALKALEWTWAGKAAFDNLKAIPAEEDNCTGMGMSYDEMDAYNDGIDAMYDLVQKAKPIIEAEPKSYDDCLNKN